MDWKEQLILALTELYLYQLTGIVCILKFNNDTTMSSKTVTKHNAKDANRRPFCVGWGTRRFKARSASEAMQN